MNIGTQQRPLTGEPVSLDLLNTVWVEGGERRDLLESVEGLTIWLKEVGLLQKTAVTSSLSTESLEAQRKALIELRTALKNLLENSKDANSRKVLNSILEKGCIREQLGTNTRPQQVLEAPEGWYAAWTVSRNFLHLLKTFPTRIKKCSHPNCVLYFLDTTKNVTRRWCSMETCGSRAKMMRYYQRKRRGGSDRSLSVEG